jgi:hypothetical protein
MAFDANDLSPHEHFVVERTGLGELADFTALAGPGGAKPAIRAGFIRKLMLGLDPTWAVRSPGVRIKGARIDGALDLTDCSALPALSLEACVIPDAMTLEHAELARLSLRDSAVTTLKANAVRIAGPFDIMGVTALVVGEPAWVWAPGAQIGGDVLARGAKLMAPAPRPTAEIPRGQRRFALNLRNATIEGSVFLVDEFAAQGGVNLESARISGALNCRGATFVAGEGAALRARGASFGDAVTLGEGFLASGEINLEGVSVHGDVRLSEGRFEGAAQALELSNADINGSVVGPFKSEGAVRLNAAHVRANLDLRGAEIGNRRTGAPQTAQAIDATALHVDGAALLQGVNAKGEVLLADARIDGYLAFGGGRFINPGNWAIRAPNVRVGGNLTLKIEEGAYAPHGQKTVIEGGAKFDRAQIAGALSWLNLELRGPGPDNAKGGKLSFADAQIAGPLQAQSFTTQQNAEIDASGARCAALDDDLKQGWGVDGAKLELDGFDYARIDARDERWKQRLAWLKRGGRFSPQPYTHAASVYARAGRREDARRILLAQHDQRTIFASAGPITWFFSSLFGVIAGYGLAPIRIVRALALFLTIGVAGVLYMNAEGALVTPQGRACNGAVEPALYAVDVALPVIDLGQEGRCAPGRAARAELSPGMEVDAHSDWRLFEGVAMWRWAHALYAILGAILTALAVITFSGVMKPKE